jgi:hypothetical protein
VRGGEEAPSSSGAAEPLAPALGGMETADTLHARLLARREEIRASVLIRIYAVADPTENGDPTYVDGLRVAVSAAVDYGLASLGASQRNPLPVPPELLVQARIAALHGIGLDTVLRRYFAGYALLGDLLIEEAEALGMDAVALKDLLRGQAARFDRLITAISAEHARESESRPQTNEERRMELVKGLLAGERLDASELAYDLTGTHLALIGKGAGIVEALRGMAARLERRLLLLRPDADTACAWLGGGRRVSSDELRRIAATPVAAESCLSVGEPGEGQDGWRVSHYQAKAALTIALRRTGTVVRYGDVALLAAVAKDDLLSTSLRQMYLSPLDVERLGGEVARATLRAYFASGRSVSSAAAALGVNRNTVTNRFRSIEEAIGRPLDTCTTEIDVALRLEQLEPWSREASS